jgi:hypothetical protein
MVLAAAPAAADTPLLPDVGGDPPSLFEEGARKFFEALIDEMEPALQGMAEGMEEFAGKMEPMLRDLVRMMGSVTDYHAPELLPNGDIIIRKRLPGEELDPEFGPDGDIEI